MQNDKIVNSNRKALIGICILFSLLSLSGMAEAENLPPMADAGGDREIYTTDCLTLKGTAYDPDGEAIVRWFWIVSSVPKGAAWGLSYPFTSSPMFCAYTPGQYLVTLVVEDPSAGSVPVTITITVRDNLPPVAVATADKIEGSAPLTVQLDASGSYDPEGRPLSEYYWMFGDGPAESLVLS